MSSSLHSEPTERDSDSSSGSDEERDICDGRRLTDFLEADGLSELEVSGDEAENHAETLYKLEQSKILDAEAKLDPDWEPRQKKRKVVAEVTSMSSIYIKPPR